MYELVGCFMVGSFSSFVGLSEFGAAANSLIVVAEF